MIAADTSACANHFLQGDSVLARLLTEEEIAVHPFIVGEIAAGNLKHRSEVLLDLSFLPQLPVAQESEVHHLLESQRLWGSGLGWIDLHILTAAAPSRCRLYTPDRAMKRAGTQLGLAYAEK